MSHSIQPNLEAGGTIRPYRFVKVSTAQDNAGLEADANEVAVGVSAGSTRQFDSANHAEDGDHITLQMGSIVNVLCAGTITRGGLVESNADGSAVATTASGTANRQSCGIALESGASGTVIRLLWKPSVTRYALS